MSDNEEITKKITDAGGQHAVTSRYRHPSVTPFVVGTGSKGVFDIEKVAEMLQSALTFIEQCGRHGQVIFFVSTRRETVDLVEKTAENLLLPRMLNRWIGGTLSNFKHIRGRVERLERLQREKDEGKWTKYTKKEKVLMNRELTKLESRFSGISTLENLPAAVFILDTYREKNAVIEANNAGIPIIGFSNANADLHVVQYPIIANIQSRDTVAYVLSLVENAYRRGASGGADKKAAK